MKAMILAAGRGERLRPLTDCIPKPLVCIAKKPLIVYHIENLVSIGVKDIVINLAWLGEKIPEALGSGDKWGVRLHYSYEKEALDTGGGIKQALTFLGNEPFLVVNGDVFIDELPIIPVLKKDEQAYVWLVDNPCHNLAGDFALSDGKISDSGLFKLTFSGIGLYRPALFLQCHKSRFPLARLLRDGMQKGNVVGGHMVTFWCDVGTVERLVALEERQAYLLS
ncbi:N-acetylmuramate alpha-1-phosphate uridylyltransferase MurU [Shewanella surugensis]|uniref:Nucleotidyltransferase family protein n=1 Tax=Shewanella surugensis TaxID=212020 RepID=A0ABT0LGN8_9GAMM|nr:nucleotidyltransferase family protein [Shewanella surugensis]MCL1126859.1 nucleotidyltransferase family protein [Shewanella surugensis]